VTEKEKRIVIRFSVEKWQRFDDKRHSERTTFQDLGEKLFDLWANNRKDVPNVTELRDKLHNSDTESEQVLEAQRPWVEALLHILQSGNDVAVRALKSNILAFSDYVRAVPEVPDGYADIAAQAKRLASLDERMVDSISALTMGSSAGTPKTGGNAPKAAVRKRNEPRR
jgi:hypothetical protein